jgi:predicted N-acyltransferase
MFEVQSVSDLAGLARLSHEWNALAASQRDPLLRHEWFMAAAVSFARDGELRLFLARDASGLRAAAPLVVDGAGRPARLRLLGFS